MYRAALLLASILFIACAHPATKPGEPVAAAAPAPAAAPPAAPEPRLAVPEIPGWTATPQKTVDGETYLLVSHAATLSVVRISLREPDAETPASLVVKEMLEALKLGRDVGDRAESGPITYFGWRGTMGAREVMGLYAVRKAAPSGERLLVFSAYCPPSQEIVSAIERFTLETTVR